MNWLGKKLNINSMDDWYNIKLNQIHKEGGSKIVAKFSSSLISLFENVYPNHNWLPWKFNQNVNKRFWEEEGNRKLFMEWLAKELKVKEIEDWYGVSINPIRKKGAGGLLMKYENSMFKVMEATYPEHKWVSWKFKVPRNRWEDLDWLNQVKINE